MRFKFKKKYFLDFPYFARYIIHFWQKEYRLPVHFYSDIELIEVIQKGKSLVRIGDGEIGLMHYNPIGYQKWSKEIQKEFIQMLAGYKRDDTYILGLPVFVGWTNDELRHGPKKGMFECWISLKLTYDMLANKDAEYFDAHAFYRDGKFEQIVLPYLTTKKCIYVGNIINTQKIKESRFAETIDFYIKAPPENAFEERKFIQKSIEDIVTGNGGNKSEFVTLMQCGLAKTIIPHMSRNGYQLLDIGRGLEGYINEVSLEYLI